MKTKWTFDALEGMSTRRSWFREGNFQRLGVRGEGLVSCKREEVVVLTEFVPSERVGCLHWRDLSERVIAFTRKVWMM